jgi:hypothetical protein
MMLVFTEHLLCLEPLGTRVVSCVDIEANLIST